jgi:hypothetical protein
MGQPMHLVPLSSHTPSYYDPQRNCIVWEDVLTFPVKYRYLFVIIMHFILQYSTCIALIASCTYQPPDGHMPKRALLSKTHFRTRPVQLC